MNLFCHILFVQQVNRLEITPDKRYLAAAGNPHIRLFDVNSNSPQPVCLFQQIHLLSGKSFLFWFQTTYVADFVAGNEL